MPKILIVEDEPIIAHEVALNLENRGYEIFDVVHSSDRALDLLYQELPDLVMLDINIEGSRNGIELAHIINEKYKIPFIFLTSFSDSETVQEASKTLPYGYLVKPFKDEDIAPAIAMALVKHQTLKVKGLPSRDVVNAQLDQKISNAEYRILEFIWQGMSNIEIADNAFLSINTVKSHVNGLYRKMEVNSKTSLLHKVRSL